MNQGNGMKTWHHAWNHTICNEQRFKTKYKAFFCVVMQWMNNYWEAFYFLKRHDIIISFAFRHAQIVYTNTNIFYRSNTKSKNYM